MANEKIIMTTLIPENPIFQVFHEGGTIGQYRLELNTSGTDESYFLNAIQLGDSSMAPLEFTVTETPTSYQVSIDSNHQVNLLKGMESTGGSIVIDVISHPFSQCTQGIHVSDTGPQWGISGCVIFKNGFEPLP